MNDDLGDQMAELAPNLRAFAWTLTRDPDETEELVQETYRRALGARSQFRPGTNLRAWLFAILHNAYLNRRRDRRVRRARTLPLDRRATDASPQAVDDVEESVVLRAHLSAVVEAFRRLPPAHAAPLHLAAVEDMSYAKIALLLDIPVGTVMSRIFRARRILIRLLTEEQL